MNDEIIKVLDAYHIKTGGNCGILTTSLAQQLDIEINELKPILNDLVRDKKITYHPSVHGLIFKIKK